MTPSEALHTAARRYLQQQYKYWWERYYAVRTEDGDEYTDSQYDLFPRYLVAAAILGEVERLTGDAALSPEEMRARLLLLGGTAESELTEGLGNATGEAAMSEERRKFKGYMASLSDEALGAVQPLPWRRRLPEAEREALRGRLHEQWGTGSGYWVPLEEASPQPVCWVAQRYLGDADRVRLHETIAALAGGRCFELTEDGVDTEVDAVLVDTDQHEVFYCHAAGTWVVYASHENTLALGGAPLIAALRGLFAGREALLDRWPEE